MEMFPALICIFTLCGAGASIAAVPSTLMPGTIEDAVRATSADHHHYQCGMEVQTPSTFMRNGTGPAIMTFVTSGIAYTDSFDNGGGPEQTADYYSGAAVLNFSNATSGLLKFDLAPKGSTVSGLDPAHQSIPFSRYAQSFDSATKVLTVRFQLAFSHCTLPVKAIFHAG